MRRGPAAPGRAAAWPRAALGRRRVEFLQHGAGELVHLRAAPGLQAPCAQAADAALEGVNQRARRHQGRRVARFGGPSAQPRRLRSPRHGTCRRGPARARNRRNNPRPGFAADRTQRFDNVAQLLHAHAQAMHGFRGRGLVESRARAQHRAQLGRTSRAATAPSVTLSAAGSGAIAPRRWTRPP